MTGRDRIVVIVVVVLAAILGGWFLVIQPKRSQASKLGQQLSSAQAQLTSVEGLVAQDEAAERSFATSYTEVARLGEAVPPDDNVPSLIYELQGAANAAHVDFLSLALEPGSGSSAPASSSSSTSKAGSAGAATAAAATLPPGAVIGAAGFPQEQFTFTFDGNFFHLANFFKRLQNFVVASNEEVSVSGRLMTLNAFSLGTGSGGFPSITASVSATTYLVPVSQGLFNGASPSGPGSSSSDSVSGASSASVTTPTATVTP